MAVNVVRAGNETPPTAVPVTEPAKANFENYVAGAGMVEARGENVAIASQISGVVDTIDVKVGDQVKAGTPLFTIDARAQTALVATKESSLKVAQAEEKNAQSQYDFTTALNDRRALSTEEVTKRKNQLLIAQSKAVAAISELNQAKTDLSRLTVVAPKDGQILRINIRPGEFAPAQVLSTPLIIMGNTDTLWVRVDVDENDAWRIVPGARGTASLRGNSALKTDLIFERFEPYVIPKRSLTGDNAERVDTRVLQVLYSFKPTTFPVFVGQLMDVYIEAKKNG